ncbi:putative retrotransposon hobs hobase [Fusarium flagelliforme]|uniref:Putative retrotransposon hobs hobase n=1 Tax=Fusarium flagelliforme TaxID=2675880 RepID=A0A395M4R4_9HYPO|nr:putative retrotransposon hobs hobase [Fusarium flagelliforme]
MGTNLVSLRKLRQAGYWWDQRDNKDIIRHVNGQPLCTLQQKHDQYVLEYIPAQHGRSAFAVNHPRVNSRTAKLPNRALAATWHRRLGHPGPRSLEHLVNHTFGARIRGPITVECDVCGKAKMKRQEHREPRKPSAKPGERVSLDFHDFHPGLGGYNSCGLFTCRASGMVWDYYFENRQEENLLAMMKNFTQMLKTMYDITLRTVETDNELRRSRQISVWLTREGIAVEECAPRTQQQNGSGERSGGVVKEKGLNWKTPYESFFSRIRTAQETEQPRIGHMKVIGCKAFAMTETAQLKDKRLWSRTNPKAWIGFLVGYNSQNIFRVWNPVTNKIYITRDVLFNEEEFFSADMIQMKETIGEQTLEEIQGRLETLMSAEKLDQVMNPLQGSDELENPELNFESQIEDLPTESEARKEPQTSKESEYTQMRFEPIPTPPESPSASFLAHIGLYPGHVPEQDLLALNQAFYAGQMAVPIAKAKDGVLTKAKRSRYIRGKLKLRDEAQSSQTTFVPERQNYHRRNLPKAPSSYGSLSGHRFEKEFKQAQIDHLKSHNQMGSWSEIARCDLRVRNAQILDCMWVFTYKFDKHGYLRKCKARLVVRGDQQQKSTTDETYAATLAGRSFRTLLAIAAKHNLELLQYDAVNAFVNAKLHCDVFMRLPPGFRRGEKEGQVLLLHKALYGLRVAPLLWQKELGGTLRTLECQQIPDEPCCYKKGNIFIFFYVDDIVIAFKKEEKEEAMQLIQSIKGRYNLTGGNDLQWFLGMEVIRDRKAKVIWVTQTMYLEKIYELSTANTRNEAPMSKEELFPNEDTAKSQTSNWYKRAVGSALYASIISRPDVSFAVSRLARFMNNPSEQHLHALNRVLNYLYATRYLGLQFGPGEGFEVYSDASYGDNTIDRKSSQGYAMKLYGSLIGWRANKQDTVTTSTTEAELLAACQAAKEGTFQLRLLNSLGELQNTVLHLNCDNTQTISLFTSSSEKMKTKLRHVDIHNHWLRERIQQKTISISFIESKENIADGFTKALQGQRLKECLQQFGLVNIEHHITKRRSELPEERTISEILEELYL